MFFLKGIGLRFVDRGDPDTHDFRVEAFTTDNTWRELNLSSIVPKNAVNVLFGCSVYVSEADAIIRFRKKGNTYNITARNILYPDPNKYVYNTFLLSLGSDRIIEYIATDDTWHTIDLNVLAWWI